MQLFNHTSLGPNLVSQLESNGDCVRIPTTKPSNQGTSFRFKGPIRTQSLVYDHDHTNAKLLNGYFATKLNKTLNILKSFFWVILSIWWPFMFFQVFSRGFNSCADSWHECAKVGSKGSKVRITAEVNLIAQKKAKRVVSRPLQVQIFCSYWIYNVLQLLNL